MPIKMLVISSLVLGSAYVNAGKLDFMQDSILSEFNPADVKSFKQTTFKALESANDGEVVFWKGETGVRGKLQAQYSYQSNDNSCRRVRFAFQNEDKHTEAYKFDICKIGEQWKISSTPASHFTQNDWDRFQIELSYSLHHVKNGNPLSWVEKTSGVSGVFVPLSTRSNNGQTCRNIAISIIDSEGRTSDGHYQFILKQDNDWKNVNNHPLCNK